MRRILVTGMTDNSGGVESVVMNYVRSLANNFHFDFWVSNEKCAFEDELKALGANVFHGRRYSDGFGAARKDMKKFFASNTSKYDLIWSNKSMLVNVDDIKFARKFRIPRIVTHAHNSSAMFDGIAGRAKAALHVRNRSIARSVSTDFLACSSGAGDYFFSDRTRASSAYRIVRNAIEFDDFAVNPTARNSKRDELEISAETKVIGFAGRLQYQKNPQFLLRTFAKYREKSPDSVLLVAGDGELRQECVSLAADLGLGDSVKFLGRRTDIRELYQAFDVLLLPSRFEGLPVVLVEAQAASLPCVVSDSVSEEVVLTDLINYLPLSAGEDVWAAAIASVLERSSIRSSTREEIISGGYEIATEARSLAKLFRERP
jgi:glycosyltransferase involved in cell wall biosynthesis